MAWSEIIDRTIHAITQLAPTIGVVATGWLGLQASKAGNLNKEQFNELKTELNTIHVIGEDNQKNIIEINNKLAVHDEAHLATMYLRLERDITTALKRGYTTVHESDIIHKMHKSYKNLGGNGYIDSLYQKYNILEVRN
jgi:hypothetical protein